MIDKSLFQAYKGYVDFFMDKAIAVDALSKDLYKIEYDFDEGD